MTLTLDPQQAGTEPATEPRRRRGAPAGGANPLVYVLALLVVAVSVGPVIYAALGGFRSNEQLARSPAGLPDPWLWANYSEVLGNVDFWRYALNSMGVALLTTVVAVGAGVMAAYPLARYRFRLREPLFMVFVLGLLFPLATAIIPLFILITRDLQLDNTWWGVALPQAAFALPVTVVILRPFLAAVPQELEDAALIDGASRITFFWRIAVPLSMPALVTVERAGLRAVVELLSASAPPAAGRHAYAAARGRRLLDRALRRHRRSPRLHDDGDAPGARPVPGSAAAHRRWTAGRGEGMRTMSGSTDGTPASRRRPPAGA